MNVSNSDIQPISEESEKRILFLLPQPFFALRGSSFRAKATLEALVSLGFIIDLICFDMGESIILTGVTILRPEHFNFIKNVSIGPSIRKIFLDFFLFLSARKAAKQYRYSAIHGVEEGGFMAHYLSNKHNIPYIFDMHSRMSEQIRHSKFGFIPMLANIFEYFEKRSFHSAAGVITVGQEHAAHVAAIYKDVPIHTLHDLPLPVSYKENEVLELRENLKLRNKKVCVYSGNFESYQGIDLLIESWKELSLKLSDISLVLIGGTASQVKNYQIQAEKLGISDSIIFMGSMPQEDTGNYLMLADVLVSPRLSGANTPLKIYSYMSCEKPIVATNISSHTQVLTEDKAYLARPEPRAFAEAIAKAFSDNPAEAPVKLNKIKLAKNFVSEYFNPDAFKGVLKKVYGFVI